MKKEEGVRGEEGEKAAPCLEMATACDCGGGLPSSDGARGRVEEGASSGAAARGRRISFM